MNREIIFIVFSFILILTSCTAIRDADRPHEKIRVMNEEYPVNTEAVTEASTNVQYSLEEIGYACETIEVSPRSEKYSCTESVGVNERRLLRLRFDVSISPTSTLVVRGERVNVFDPTGTDEFGMLVDMKKSHIAILDSLFQSETKALYTPVDDGANIK